MRMMSIASGSSGNCIYIGSDNTHILIDAGISRRRIEEGLNNIGLSLKDISGIFVTHEHSDHIQGLGVISRRDEIPVFSSKGTIEQIAQSRSLGNFNKDVLSEVKPDFEYELGDLFIKPFRVSHDASEPVCYTVCSKSDSVVKKASVCTDLGIYNDYIVENLKKSDIMLVEANHDINMLEVGPYPYYLKRRILGERGHLSNESSGQLINELLHNDLKKVFLGHLSKENNYDRLAYETVKIEIDMSDNDFSSKDFDIEVARRDTYSTLYEF